MLSDPDKRERYDQLGTEWRARERASDDGNFEDFFDRQSFGGDSRVEYGYCPKAPRFGGRFNTQHHVISASSAPVGTIVRYAWRFGDGTSQTTISPMITHVFAKPGAYTTTLTVTDDAGCSTAVVFAGQTARATVGLRRRRRAS